MPEVACGFNDVPGGASGQEMLTNYGPTLFVNIGFDASFKPGIIPSAAPRGLNVGALVDTGATESCIDSMLAANLGLPLIDVRAIAGVGGSQKANFYLAQIHVPSLNFTIHGAFAGVHLVSGGQWHQAIIGRTFLRHCKMIYDGTTGTVLISHTLGIPPKAHTPPSPSPPI